MALFKTKLDETLLKIRFKISSGFWLKKFLDFEILQNEKNRLNKNVDCGWTILFILHAYYTHKQ
jgi:hypothetical protein